MGGIQLPPGGGWQDTPRGAFRRLLPFLGDGWSTPRGCSVLPTASGIYRRLGVRHQGYHPRRVFLPPQTRRRKNDVANYPPQRYESNISGARKKTAINPTITILASNCCYFIDIVFDPRVAIYQVPPTSPEQFYDIFIHIRHHDDPLIVPSPRPIGIIHTSQSPHVTGPPNPSADYFVVVIGEVQGHDRRTKGGRSRSSSAAYASLQIVRADFDFPATPPPAIALANTALVSYPPVGWGGRAAPFWVAEAIEYAPCLQQSPLLRAPLAHPSWLQR